MRVISWNCNLKFKEKFELVSSYNPDICFIQECEKLSDDFFPDYDYFWTGRNEKKGLGIWDLGGFGGISSGRARHQSDLTAPCALKIT